MQIDIEQIDGTWPEWALSAVDQVLSQSHFPVVGIDASQVLNALVSVPAESADV